MRHGATIAAILTALWLHGVAHADTLTLKAGDQYTGTLTNIGDGMAVFRTKIAGKVYVSTDEIAAVHTTNLVMLDMGDGKLLAGRLRTENGVPELVSQDGNDHRPIALADIKGIDQVPAATTGESASGLSGSLETGYRFREGTVDYSGPTASLELSHGAENGTEISARIDTEYVGDAGSTGRFFDAELRARLGTSGTWKPQLTLSVERDRNMALDYRVEAVAGVARDLHRDERQSLSVEGGVGATIAEYDSGLLRRDQGYRGEWFPGDRDGSSDELNLHLRLNYSRLLFGATIEEGIEIVPSLSDTGDVRGSFFSALYIPITPRMKLKLDINVDYDGDPRYRDIDEWRTSVGASLRFHF